MNINNKDNELDFLNVVIDCCAYIFLFLFWVFILLIPLFYILFLYKNFPIDVYFVIFFVLIPMFIALPLLILSRGLIYRNRIIMLISSLLSFILLYYNMINIKNIDKTNIVKFVMTFENSLLLIVIGIALIVGLFIKKVNTKK
jgi:hypothetical protein